jgi:hypothetical protein
MAIRASEGASPEAQIAGLLESRSQAVLALDRETFLAGIATVEPEFLVEQASWFDDLFRSPLSEYRMAVDALDVAGEQAAGAVEEEWRYPEGRGRTIRYEALFLLEEGTWRFAGPNFATYSSEQFAVRAYPAYATLAIGLLPILEELYGVISADLGMGLSRRAVVKLYPSEELLQGSIYPSYVQSLSGWNEPREAIKIRVRSGTTAAGLRVLLAHELTHNLMFERAGGSHGAFPWWVEEGTAEHEAGFFLSAAARAERDAAFARIARAGQLVDWEAIADFHTASPSAFPRAYDQGRSMIAYITGRFGREARNAWLDAMAAGNAIEIATVDVLGLPFGRLSSDWRASL